MNTTQRILAEALLAAVCRRYAPRVLVGGVWILSLEGRPDEPFFALDDCRDERMPCGGCAACTVVGLQGIGLIFRREPAIPYLLTHGDDLLRQLVVSEIRAGIRCAVAAKHGFRLPHLARP